ncbi:MAG: 4a-hydroxytetrahydrobiopterin dehydratase [Thiobacillus sp.]|nr:4a-hydroxytetrahydrobiopterin dehydratase [Thiobacillus sp.]
MVHTIDELVRKKCAPCEGGVAAMTDAQITPMLKGLPGWQRDGDRIFRNYAFKDHYQVQAFTNAVMWISHREDHHPNLVVGYNTVKVEYWTHAIGGLSENDFICAAKVDQLVEQ